MRIRPADASDLPFLHEMLFEAAFRPGLERPSVEEMLARPEVAKYVEGGVARVTQR